MAQKIKVLSRTCGVLTALAVSGALGSGAAAAQSSPVLAPGDQLLSEYVQEALEVRHALGISDDDHDLTQAEYEQVIGIVNANGQFDILFDQGETVPGGEQRNGPSDYYPGPNQTRVCTFNPIDCERSLSARTDANNDSSARYPTFVGTDDVRDADRHCVWQALTTKRANAGFAAELGDAHEADGNADGSGNPAANAMDQFNNGVGRQVGLENENTPDSAIYDRCSFLADTGGLATIA